IRNGGDDVVRENAHAAIVPRPPVWRGRAAGSEARRRTNPDVRGSGQTGSMDPVVLLIIGLLLGLAIGAVLGVVVARSRQSGAGGNDTAVLEAQHQTALSELRAREQAAQAQLAAELAFTQATADALRDQVSGLQQQHRELME